MPPPDVFLVTIDTLRADHVHCYGDESIETPALDGLANDKDGIRFTQAFTPSPITNTSHATILTGLLPSTHGVTDFAVPLSPTHATWAELLHAGESYHTAAFIGAVILDSKTLAPGFDRGFDFYDNFPEQSNTKSRWGRVERRGMDVVERAEAWLRAHPRDRTLSGCISTILTIPTSPQLPIRKSIKITCTMVRSHMPIRRSPTLSLSCGKMDGTRTRYRGRGRSRRGLGEHHENTHGIFLYDSTTHVPLILNCQEDWRLRGGWQVKVVDAQVRTTDILPTVIDLVGATVPERLDGESLRPYFAHDIWLRALPSARRIIPCVSDGRRCGRCAPTASSLLRRHVRSSRFTIRCGRLDNKI